jgi:ribonuclease HI
VVTKTSVPYSRIGRTYVLYVSKNYPLQEWVHVFTDGSQDNGSNSGYGLHCIFFEESHAMEPGLSTFDAEVKAIVRAVERIAETAIFPLRKTKFVILSDSKAAIQFITKAENYDELSLSFKQNLVMIGMQKKLLQLQWIPSHCKIPGNEKADALAKIGAKKKPPPSSGVPYHSAKAWIKKKLRKFFGEHQETQIRERPWRDAVKKGPDKRWTRRVATAQFRLATGHDCLQHHLNKTGITKDPATCKLCKIGVQDRAHLFSCAALSQERDSLLDDLSRQEKEAHLYWIARKRNGQQPTTSA